jgi:hypothetical protein
VLEELRFLIGLVVERLPRGDLEGEVELLRQGLHRCIDDVILAAPSLGRKENGGPKRTTVGQGIELGPEGDQQGKLQGLLVSIDIVHGSSGVSEPRKYTGSEEGVDLLLGVYDLLLMLLGKTLTLGLFLEHSRSYLLREPTGFFVLDRLVDPALLESFTDLLADDVGGGILHPCRADLG